MSHQFDTYVVEKQLELSLGQIHRLQEEEKTLTTSKRFIFGCSGTTNSGCSRKDVSYCIISIIRRH